MVTFQIADVGKCLLSVKKSADKGNTVIFESKSPRMISKKGRVTKLQTDNGVYIMKCEALKGEAAEGDKIWKAGMKKLNEERSKKENKWKGRRKIKFLSKELVQFGQRCV